MAILSCVSSPKSSITQIVDDPVSVDVGKLQLAPKSKPTEPSFRTQQPRTMGVLVPRQIPFTGGRLQSSGKQRLTRKKPSRATPVESNKATRASSFIDLTLDEDEEDVVLKHTAKTTNISTPFNTLTLTSIMFQQSTSPFPKSSKTENRSTTPSRSTFTAPMRAMYTKIFS